MGANVVFVQCTWMICETRLYVMMTTLQISMSKRSLVYSDHCCQLIPLMFLFSVLHVYRSSMLIVFRDAECRQLI